MEIAQSGPSAMQQLQGLGIEMGGTIAGTYATTKALKTQRVARGLSFLKNIRRAGQAAVTAGVAGPQAAEPVSTVGGLVTFGLTEGAWALGSNFVKQEYFKALGVQEETSGGELLASALLVGPLISQGRKIPKIGQVFDTSMINSRKWRVGAHVVQGSIIGSVESSIRQTFDLMADEDASIGDFSMSDLFTGAAGGAAFGGTLGLGSDTIGLIKTYRAVVARSKVEMRGSLVERLAKLDKAIAKAQKIGMNRNRIVAEMQAAKVKEELDQLDAVHDSIDEKLAETEDAVESLNAPKEAPAVTEEQVNLANDWDARKAAEGEEVTPTNLEGVDVVEAPEASATTATPKDAPEATPAPKPIIQFKKDGVPYKVEGTYIRFGDLPDGPSNNFVTGGKEEGHSVYLAYFDPKTKKYIIQDRSAEVGVGTLDRLIAGVADGSEDSARKIYEISGKKIAKGQDGEPILDASTSKQVKEINRSDVVLRDEPFQDIDLQPLDKESGFNMDDATMDFPEGFKLADYTYKKNDAGSFDIFKDGKLVDDELRLLGRSKISSESEAKKLIEHNIDEDLIDFNIAQKDSPAPKTPFQALMDDYDAAIAEQSQGRGADQIIKLNKHFNAISDDFAKKADALIANPNAESVDELLAMLDEYTAFDAKDAELKQKTGQDLRAQARDAENIALEREPMSEARAIRNQALKDVREKLQAMKDDVDGAEMQKLVEDIFTYPEPVKKGKSTRTPSPDEDFMPPPKDGEAPTDTPKDGEAPVETPEPVTAQEVSNKLEKLENELKKLQARFGDDSVDLTPKQKKAKEDKHKEIKAKIAFYKRGEKAALDLDKNQRELERLKDVIKRGDPKELEFEGFTKAEILKGGQSSGRLNEIKKDIASQKKIIREMARPPKPKLTPKERSIARLQKKLNELRAIRSGEQDPKAPKPKKRKSAEEKDLEERIKFYQGESKEVDAIAASQERIQVLSGLIQGNSPSQIRQQIGIPPKLLPAHAKPKKIETTLTKLKATEAKLMKILRRKQTDAILSDMRNVFDPEHGSRSIVDTALNGYLTARTDALLNQPSTATTGLPSGYIRVIWDPLKRTGINTIQALNPADRALKGVPMTQRMKFAAADVLATADQLITFAQSPIVTSKQAWRNTVDTFKQGGSSGYFYKDANKIDVRDTAENAGNSSIRNTRQVLQGDIRARANEQKSVIVRQAMKLMGSDPATALMALSKAIWSGGRRGVGALDEPFNLILQGRGVRAEAIKEAIKQQVKPEDVAGFIDDYIQKSSTVDNQGVKRFNYLDEKYRNTANQTRRGLFRPADLDKNDPRMLMEETLVQSIRSWTGGDLTASKFLFRFLQPIITTPTIALAQQGRIVAQTTGLPALVDVGQRLYAGGAKRVGKQGKISNVMSGRINKEINDLEIKVEDRRAKTKEKGLDKDEQKKRDEDLAAHQEQLKSLRDYRDEQTYEQIAMMALGMGIVYTFFELGKNGLATGAGAFLTRDQRNQGEFQKYRMLMDEDSEGMSYLLAEPIRFLAAFSADLGAWSALEGSTTEKQTIGNFVTSTLEAYATDAVFTTSLRHMKDLAFGKEKSRTGAMIDIAAGGIPIPSGIRSARVLDDEKYSVYDEGADVGDMGSRAFDKAVGTEAENFRVDKLGRPLLRPERGALNYVFRYAPEDRAYRMTAEEEVRKVLRNDGLSYNLIPKMTEFKTINGTQVNLKEFTSSGRSLFNLFAEVVNDGDEMLHELHDLVTDEDWQMDYDNYTVEPDPDNQDKLYNKGIDRLKEVRQKHVDRAVDYISDESNINLYRNKDGQTVHEYIKSLEERPARSGNVLEKLNQF
jgi:hypothetical protein